MKFPSVVGTTVALVLGLGGSAYAGVGAETHEQAGSRSGSSISSRVSVRTEEVPEHEGEPGTLSTPTWTPPPCWYEPLWTARAFRTFMEAQWEIREAVGGGSGADEAVRYGDFHVGDEKGGMWWGAVDNPGTPGDARPGRCARRPFWVSRGTTPSVPDALTPATLAALAYQATTVPDTRVEMAPAGRSLVNLPVWLWLDRARLAPVSVTASLPAAGLWARTTATPVGLRVDPGATQALTYPESGRCPLGGDGRIGAPRLADAPEEELPRCGVLYLKGSGDRPYGLRATLDWRVRWVGSGGSGGELPAGRYGGTRAVTVREVQSVVRTAAAPAGTE